MFKKFQQKYPFATSLLPEPIPTAVMIIGVLGFITLAILLRSPLNPLCKGPIRIDSGVFKYVALVMSKGGMPYKDAFDHKGPLMYIINYLGLLISYYRGLWIIEYVFMFGFFAITYLTARIFCSKAVSLLMVALSSLPLNTYFQSGNYTEEFALVFIALGLYIFIDYFLNSHISKCELIVCGASLAAVLLLRVNMAAIWIVFPIAVLIKCIREKSFAWISFLLWFILGMAIVIVPIFLWLILNGAFADFINDYIIFNLKYSSDATQATILNRCLAFTHFFARPLLFGATIINIYMILEEKEYRVLNSAYLAGILVTLFAIAIPGRVYNHYGMTVMPLLVYPYSWLVGRRFGSRLKKFETNKRFLVFFLVTIVLSQWYVLGQTAISRIISHLGKDTFSQSQRDVVALIKKNTAEDDRIIVLGDQNIWYVLSKRLAASRYSYQDPIAWVDERIKEEFMADMEATSPKLVVLVRGFEDFFARKDDYDCIYESENKKLSVYLLSSAKD